MLVDESTGAIALLKSRAEQLFGASPAGELLGSSLERHAAPSAALAATASCEQRGNDGCPETRRCRPQRHHFTLEGARSPALRQAIHESTADGAFMPYMVNRSVQSLL